MKRTYQRFEPPEVNKHGFRERMSTPNGRSGVHPAVLTDAKKLTVSSEDRF